jgi:hypothetical protein
MSEVTTKNIALKLNDIAHLFVAPEFDPFSDQEADLLGQPALVLVLRQLGPRTVSDGQPFCLTLQLPPDKVTPDLKARAAQALRRYCAARIADNEAQLRVLRWNGWRWDALACPAPCSVLRCAHTVPKNGKGCSGQVENTRFRDNAQADKGTLLESVVRRTEQFGRRARREWNNSSG